MCIPRKVRVLPSAGAPRSSPVRRPAVRVEVLDDEVALGDVVVGFAAPVGHRGPHHLRGLAQAVGAVGRAGEGRVVVDEVGRDIPVDGGQVALGEQLLDEALDEVLVAGELVGCHAEKNRPCTTHGTIPAKWGSSTNRPR